MINIKKALIMPSLLFMGLLFSVNNVVDVKKEIQHHSELIKIPTSTMRILLNQNQIYCLVKNTYYEARGEPVDGKAAVVRVVINRVLHEDFSNTPCKVIEEYHYRKNDDKTVKVCQFSWKCESDLPPLSKNSQTYKEIEKLVLDILIKNMYHDVVTPSTLFFHAVYVRPNWAYKKLKQIGNHIFYELK